MGDILEALEALEVELRCSICLCPMQESRSIAGCGHCFCQACIEHGLKVSSKCPLCKNPASRRTIRVNDIPQIDKIVAGIEELRTIVDGLNVNELIKKEKRVTLPSLSQGRCHFCSKGKLSEISLLGSITPHEVADGNIIFAHEGCASWTCDVYFSRSTGKPLNLDAGLLQGKRQLCVSCHSFGATIRCSKKACPRVYHLPCAVETKTVVLNEDNRELWCPEHTDLAPVVPNAESSSDDDTCRIFSQGTEKVCFKCSLRDGNLLCCDACNRNVHLLCHNPPLEAAPLGRFHCQDCTQDGGATGPQVERQRRRNGVVLIHTGLQPAQKLELEKVAKRLKAKIVADVTEEVTHVITSAKSTSETPRRTGKLLKAIVSGKIIVTFNWVSTAAAGAMDRWPDSELFELEGRGKEIRLSDQKLFDNKSFYLGAYKKEVPSRLELEQMIRFGGGKVLSRLPTGRDGESFVVREQHEQELGTKRKRGRPPLRSKSANIVEISERWIMDKISGL